MSLHNTQKLDDHLGRGADQDLSLAASLCVYDVVLSQDVTLAIIDTSKPEMDKQGSHSARGSVRSGDGGTQKPDGRTKTDTRTMSGQGSGGGRWAVSEGGVSIHEAQSECRATESASRDWDFDQRASDCTSPIAR